MRRLLLAVCLLVLMLCPRAMVVAKTRDYPIRVQVVRSHWHGRRGWAMGFGRANVISQQPGQPPEQGMNFNYECSSPVRNSFGPDTYPARYGKNRFEVVVLLPEPGSDKTKECTLKADFKDYVYVRTGHGLAAAPLGGGPQTNVQDDEDQ